MGDHHRPAIDKRTTRHPGYSISQRIRKRVEEIFGRTKTVALFRKTRFNGVHRTDFASRLVGAAYSATCAAWPTSSRSRPDRT